MPKLTISTRFVICYITLVLSQTKTRILPRKRQSKLMEPPMRKYVHGIVSVYPCKNHGNRSINLSTGVYPRSP